MIRLWNGLHRLWKTPDYVKCYLCLEKVKEKHWDNGSHRLKNGNLNFINLLNKVIYTQVSMYEEIQDKV